VRRFREGSSTAATPGCPLGFAGGRLALGQWVRTQRRACAAELGQRGAGREPIFPSAQPPWIGCTSAAAHRLRPNRGVSVRPMSQSRHNRQRASKRGQGCNDRASCPHPPLYFCLCPHPPLYFCLSFFRFRTRSTCPLSLPLTLSLARSLFSLSLLRNMKFFLVVGQKQQLCCLLRLRYQCFYLGFFLLSVALCTTTSPPSKTP
jgi:hypothetical protein